jgi:hypothetical protein
MEETEQQKIVALDELTVSLVRLLVYSMISLKRDKDTPR